MERKVVLNVVDVRIVGHVLVINKMGKDKKVKLCKCCGNKVCSKCGKCCRCSECDCAICHPEKVEVFASEGVSSKENEEGKEEEVVNYS